MTRVAARAATGLRMTQAPVTARLRILYVEPFHAGSHAAFTRTLTEGLDHDWHLRTLPGRHWKWRMRGSAVHLALCEPPVGPFDLVFASSYVPLAELQALLPAARDCPAVLYFHENQLAFPVREAFAGERDHHFGVTQMVSALAATRCVFNSAHNRDSFLAGARRLLARMPDAVPPSWVESVAARSEILGVPLDLPATVASAAAGPALEERARGPIILWNHRWEHDKGPGEFFAVLERLAAAGVPFRLAVCGRRFRQAPPEFDRARRALAGRFVHFGPIAGRADYWALLGRAHLAVSTARHEFFGISALEAAWAGAFTLVPDALAYPEHFPRRQRYRDMGELEDRLGRLCRRWSAGEIDLRGDYRHIVAPYAAPAMLPRYDQLLRAVSGG